MLQKDLGQQDLDRYHKSLQEWYLLHGRRELPWRKTRDPYAIYVSEIMLQQTQVKTVLERYYFPFLERFPTLESLASTPQEAVLQAWQGLGYYNRALNLHKAAKRSGGVLPSSVDRLLELPGIGRNTAHAVAAFAYHQPVAVMEANVKRVLSRIFTLSVPNEAVLWKKAEALLNHKEPFDYNQALMDIGALVCKKKAPLCTQCPASFICSGKETPELYPASKTKKSVPVRKKTVVVLKNSRNQYYAVPRTTRFLNGLFHFIELDAGAAGVTIDGKRVRLDSSMGMGQITQKYSHFTLNADIYCLETKSGKGKNWYSLPRLRTLPMSMAEQKIITKISALQ